MAMSQRTIEIASQANIFDDAPFISDAINSTLGGQATVTLFVYNAFVEDIPGEIGVVVQGSDDRENWTEIESNAFSTDPAQSYQLHSLIFTRWIRLRAVPQNGAVSAIVSLEIGFAPSMEGVK